MTDRRVHADIRGRERIVAWECDCEMHRSIALSSEDQARRVEVLRTNVKFNIGVGLLLELGDVLQKTLTK